MPLLAEVLRSVLVAVTVAEGEPPEQVVLTCPAVWGPVRRQQFGEVSRRAGLTSVAVVSEPEAAVTSLVDARRLVEDDVVLVYDLGGVSADLTVVRVTSTGVEILGLPEGAEGAGGSDFDDQVLMHVDRAVGGALTGLDLSDPVAVGVLAGVRAECIRAKEALSRIEIASIRVVGFAQEVAPVRLTRPEFELLIEEPLRATLPGLHRVLNSAGVRPEALTGVLLVGGSSRIPRLARLLHEELGCPILVDDFPQHCVALGAAAIAGGTTTISDGALEITPGAPPVTNSIPRIGPPVRPARPPGSPPMLRAAAAEVDSTFFAAPVREPAVADLDTPMLPRRAGGHRMPKMGDWRHRAAVDWDALIGRPWRLIAIAVLTVLLIVGGMYAYSPGAVQPAAGSALDNQIITILPRPAATTTRSSPIAASDPTVTQSPEPSTEPSVDGSGASSGSDDRPGAGSGSGADSGSDAGSDAEPDESDADPDEPDEPTPSKTSQPQPTAIPKPKPVTPPAAQITGRGALVGFAARCLDVKEGSTVDGTVVQLFECNGLTAQAWTAWSDGSLQALGKCLQVVDLGEPELRLALSTCTGADTQQWRVASGAIINPELGRCVDILRRTNARRIPATMAECHGGAGQRWRFRS